MKQYDPFKNITIYQSNLLLFYLVEQLWLAISDLCTRTIYSNGLYIDKDSKRSRIDQLTPVIFSLVRFDSHYFLTFNVLVR